MLFKPLQEKITNYNVGGSPFLNQIHNNSELASNYNDNGKVSRGLFGTFSPQTNDIGRPEIRNDIQSNGGSALSCFFQKFQSQQRASKHTKGQNLEPRGLFVEKNMHEQNDADDDNEMDIESTEDSSNTDKENKQTNAFDYKDPSNIDTPYKSQMEGAPAKQGLFAALNGKPEEFTRPSRRKSSLIQMWKTGDPIFAGKFSTGATPKIQKEEFVQPILANLFLKRANSDIPPTLENGLTIVDSKDQHFGNNKYMNHAKKIDRTPYPNKDEQPYRYNPAAKNETYQQATTTTSIDFGRFKSVKPSKLTNQAPENSRNVKQQNRGGLAFARNLFGDDTFGDTGNSEIQRNLFLIPELNGNSEGDLDQVVMKNENEQKRISVRKYDMDESFNRDDEEEFEVGQRGNSNECRKKLFGDEDECQTPSKRNVKMIADEKDFLHTALRGQKNKMDIINASASTDAHTSNHSSMEFTSFGSFNKMQHKKREVVPYSRFKADYEDLEILGSGHFGTVYKCLNKIDGLMYAIKSIKYKKKGVSHINQALNEVQALASLSAMDENPFIVRYYNVWMEEDMVYLVMEYCPSNLRNIEGLQIKFSESMIRQVLRDVCMGLKLLHKQKIVHLDIKPENILYSRTHKYKIADLGLSRIAERQAGEDVHEGDSRYLAPELLNDYSESLPDLTKADIFSLGVTIYELMTGQTMPKNGPEWRTIRSGHLPRLENLKNYSNSLKSIIKLMLSPNPDQRPSAQDLIENFLQSELELELRWEKVQNQQLKKKVKEYEQKLRIHRKNSF